MGESTTPPIAGPTPGSQDVLTEILLSGARKLLAEAIEAEVAAWIDGHADIRDGSGRRLVVRNGSSPEPGASGRWRASGTSTSGPMGSTSTSAWSRTGSASSS